MSCSDIFLGLIAVLFPPIAVWIKRGICSADSLLNILLCMLGFIPGLLHAWYIIAKYPEHDYDALDGDVEGQGGRVTYYYISHEPAGRGRGRRQQGTPVYGAIPSAPGNKAAPPLPPANRHNVQYQQSQQSGVVRNEGSSRVSGGPVQSSAGASSRDHDRDAPPPAYSEVVRGDHKIQSRD